MKGVSANRLLVFAKELQRAATFAELLEITRVEVESATGYAHVWLMISDHEQVEEVRLLDCASIHRERMWELAPVLKIAGDAMLEQIVQSHEPVVVEDARIDPRTNKTIVEQLGNRTIINIPLRLLDKPFGAFGLGTFHDEGCRPPTPDELEQLIGMGAQLAVAVGRIRYLEERASNEKGRIDLERRLFQVQKLESLGMLAGGIAHDFNNLLTVILASGNLLRDAITNEDARQDADAVIAAAERGRDLTRQLLAMSRAQPLELTPTDLNDRLRQLISLIRRLFTAEIEIDLIQGTRLPLVDCDGAQLDQVFMNLCINARDAMPNGGRITIETEHVVVNGAYAKTHPWAQPGRYVLTTVTDTGTGMPPEVLERVFEPFYTTKTERAGTGLGLAVAYGIVRQHGGMLHSYSEMGVGSTFKVYLPVHTRAAVDVGTKITGAVPSGTERVLVAEDDPSIRLVVERVLTRAGYEVRVVEDGEEACEAAKKYPFDLVVLDVVMPTMNGHQALKKIRALLPNARFILSSGYAPQATTAELLESGASELLAKPYDPDRLLRAVRRVLDSRQPT
jgi:signal transduction histidine kinase/ActR/RegA family two-component response regulator